MRQRSFVATGILAVLFTALSLSLAGQTAKPAPTVANPVGAGALPEGQAEAAQAQIRARQPAPKGWVAPKTAWGEPDLQGVWSYAATTPLNRPPNAGDRELSQAEIDALAEGQADRQDGPAREGDTGTYQNFWWDRGQSIGRTSLIIDPPDGRQPPLTAEAQKVRAAAAAYRNEHENESYLDRSVTDRCISYHGVPPLPSGYNNTYEIFQTPGQVAILDEDIHHVRLVPMDNRPHLTSEVRHWNGDSRGRWEGNTLVIETTNFSPKSSLRYGGSESTTAVERYTRNGPYSIDYRYTITDPKVFTKPFTVGLPLSKRDDLILEYACHEGNYSLTNILSGARHQEAEALRTGIPIPRNPGRGGRGAE